jgi:hypothetical protein
MHCNLFAVAESSSIDIATQRLSIFNIWEDITTANLPAFVPSMALVAILTREENEPRDVELQVIVTLNGNNILAQLQARVSFQSALKARAVINVQGMVFNEQGVCEIAIRHADAEPLGSWTMRVNLVAHPQIQTVEAVPPASSG